MTTDNQNAEAPNEKPWLPIDQAKKDGTWHHVKNSCNWEGLARWSESKRDWISPEGRVLGVVSFRRDLKGGEPCAQQPSASATVSGNPSPGVQSTEASRASNAPAEEVQSLPGAGQALANTILGHAHAAPLYRPLAPDEVPQVGDEHKVIPEGDWVKCDEFWSMRSATWLNIYQFRTTRPALQPAPVAGTPLVRDMLSYSHPGCFSRDDYAEAHQQAIEKARSLESALAVANAERDLARRKARESFDEWDKVRAENAELRKALEKAQKVIETKMDNPTWHFEITCGANDALAAIRDTMKGGAK